MLTKESRAKLKTEMVETILFPLRDKIEKVKSERDTFGDSSQNKLFVTHSDMWETSEELISLVEKYEQKPKTYTIL